MRTARSTGLHLALAFGLLLCLPRLSLAQFVDVAVAPLNDAGDTQGASWIDYDGDGDQDLFFANAGTGDNKLLRNDSSTFVDVTPALLGDSGNVGSGVAWGDYDNDGDADLFVANAASGADRLFRNDGGGTFINATSGPLGDLGTGTATAWVDYDLDGDLDLSLTNANETNRLFRNDGSGTFADVTPAQMGDTGTGMAWGDYDGDGDPDLYMGDNAAAARLIRNDGEGNFADVTPASLALAGVRGADWGDYDNDGDLDLAPSRASAMQVFRNDGSGSFAAVATLAGTNAAFGVAWGDYDRDGDLDIYIARDATTNRLFRNDSGAFVDVTSGDAGNAGRQCRGVIWGDYDQDGDLDLYLANTNSTPINRLLRNDFSSSNRWLHVKLSGRVSNRSGIGARVRVVSGSLRQIQEVSGGSGYASQNSLPVEFGFGPAATVDTLEIRWPSGIVQQLVNVPTNQVLAVTEGGWVDVTAGPLESTANTQGIAWGDMDGDGDQDLYLSNFGTANDLLRNDGGSSFVNIAGPPINNGGNGQGVVWGDYNNDGRLDLYLANSGSDNKLFRNEGFEFFSDVTTGFLSYNGPSRSVAFVDFDNDGDLDLYLVTASAANSLLRNDGLSFSVSTAPPIGDTGDSRGCAWADYDNDGDQDVYIAKANQANKLIRNEGGGTFVDATNGPLGNVGNGQGVAWGDYDNDGDLDVYLANGGSGNRLFRNEEAGKTFVDVTSGPLGSTRDGRGVTWGDFDQDGDLDIYVANQSAANQLFRNDGGGSFSDVTSAPLGNTGAGQGAAWADYDQDGDLDLYLANGGSGNKLIRNEGGTGNHWLQVKLVGTRSNRAGIGARVTLVTGATRRIQEVSGGSGYFSQNSLPVEFGLGTAATVDSLIVNWPSGIRQVVSPPSVDTIVNVQESDGSFAGVATGLLAVAGGAGVAWGDYDNDGDQDLFQTDIPNKLFRNDGGGLFVNVASGTLASSGSGDAAVWGDYDQDGDLDLYLTHLSGPNQLFRNDSGVFADVTTAPLDHDGLSKAATWADYDRDGDLDLLLCTGAGGDGLRLYRNEGAGTFNHVTSGDMAGLHSTINAVWGDYDGDGDSDVYATCDFFGSNKLFRNDGSGVFANVTGGVLSTRGSGAAWGDYDNDGDLDLYVSLADYINPNKLFRNDGGAFVDATSGPLGNLGIGYSVAWGDYDNDGDLDLYLAKATPDSDGSKRQSDSKLFRNEGGPGFAFVDVMSGPLGTNGLGAAWADYDSDGDIDLFVPSGNVTANRLMRNEIGTAKNWLHVKLVGKLSNRFGIGTRVTVVTGSARRMQEVSAGSGFYSQDSFPLEFGLGTATSADTVVVRWPSGIVQRLTNVATNQVLQVSESYFALVSGGPLGDSGPGSGVAWGDADQDGDLDLYLPRMGQSNRLLRNEGGSFVDATSGPLGNVATGHGVAWGDFDDDGDLDLYVANGGEANKLFRNDGGGGFVDVTSGPLGDTGLGRGVAWVDYDEDGDLDIYLANNGSTNKLFRNDGGSGFVDATSAPLADSGPGQGVAWGDYDNDGDPDLYLANFNQANKLFRNEGSGTFVDATSGPLGDTGAGSGVAWADYDNDGDLDLALANLAQSNKLFRNEGSGVFVDATSGPVGGTGGIGVAWADYDNDGDQDLYVANNDEVSKLLRNEGGSGFVDVTVSPFGGAGPGMGAAWGDYDSDGDLDLYAANFNEADQLFRNESSNNNHWLHLNLIGRVSNRAAIGARVRAVAGSLRQIQEVSGGSGYLSQNSLTVEFGLGAATVVDTVEIRWPSGILQRLTNVASNQILAVTESEWTNVSTDPSDAAADRAAGWGDYDNDGDEDLYVAVNGTNKLLRNDGNNVLVNVTPSVMQSASGIGTGVGWGDFDNDGDLDLYLVNQAGDTNRLFRNEGGGNFSDITSSLLASPGQGSSGVWGDYDNDGDVDLYLTFFSGTCQLLRNDEGGLFADVTNGPLGESGDTRRATWVDYDNDRDLDLYLSKHLSSNKLLRNDGGGLFADVTAGPLASNAQGRGTPWADYDNDGDLDVFLAIDFGPDKLLRNDGGGSFADVTPALMADTNRGVDGSWADYDRDGDLDLYVTNLNNVPQRLFRNDAGSFVDHASGELGDFSTSGSGSTPGPPVWADSDQDGDLDVYIPWSMSSGSTANRFFRNDALNSNRWLKVKLIGTVSNRSGIGAHIRCVTGSLNQLREVSGGHRSQNSLVQFFGVGAATTVDTLEVLWPSGSRQWFVGVAANQTFTITEEASFADVTSGSLAGTGNGASVAWGDYDKDGDPDLLLSSFSGQESSLLRNDAGTFIDATSVPFGQTGNARAVTWADYDNDGDLDAFMAAGSGLTNKLIRNDGSGTFVNVATSLIGNLGGIHLGAAWGDYDNDGDVDLYVSEGGNTLPNKMFRNDGMAGFVDATTGSLANTGFDRYPVWGDYDNDGDVDLYLSHRDTKRLLRNDGQGVFADVTTLTVADPQVGGAASGAEPAWGDFDNDGDLDLVLGNINLANRMFRNDGGGVFADVAGGTPLGGSARGVAWGDYDNDGDLDLYCVSGDNRLLRNDAGSFVNVTSGPLPGVAAQASSAAWADYDGDGDLDLYLVNTIGATNKLFRNELDNGNHWLHVDLTGSMSNRSAIGARVRAVAGSLVQVQEVSGGSNSQNSLTVEFGLGQHTAVDTLEIRWPSGQLQRLTGVAVNQRMTVQESEFSDATSGPLGYVGNGSGVAWGDYDNDGDLDIFLSNNASEPDKLFRNDSNGAFADATPAPLADPGNGQGAAWGDYDNDGDLDLYLANSSQANKLFRNESGSFSDVTSTPLNDTGGGRNVAWADYDRDGDLDLYLTNFTGTHKLFRNDGAGGFADVTSGPLGGTGSWGMAWADYDNDGDLDIYLSTNSGGDHLLRNDGGSTFSDVASGPLLDAGNGHGVAWADYDNDGDLDVFVTNGITGDNKLFRNDGSGTFADATTVLLANTGQNDQGVAWGDYDLDGDPDLYLTSFGPNKLFRNEGGGAFADVSFGPIAHSGNGNGVAWADYDGDGDLDLYFTNAGSANKLLRNNLVNGHHWLHVNLVGTVSNRAAIGARVRAVAGSLKQIQEISGGSGLFSQNSLALEFGFGTRTTVDTLEVSWPSGKVQKLTQLAVDNVITVVEPLDAPPSSSFPLAVWAAPSDNGETPGLLATSVTAAGDVNADGFDDVLVGSSQGKVLLYLGGASSNGVPALTMRGEWSVVPYEEFGKTLDGAGDVNGDGYDDWIIGARLHGQAGRAYLYLGGSSPNATADLILDEQVPWDEYGAVVAGVGDLNNDGYDDWAVAAPGNDAGGTDAGRIYVYFGGSTPNVTPDLSITGVTVQGFFARAVAGGGDLNADGFDDMLIGGEGASEARVYLGGSAVNSIADLVVLKPAGNPAIVFCRGLSLLGDVNGDGRDDFTIDGTDAPAASVRSYIYFGAAMLDATPDLTLSTQGNSAFTSPIGDINADGFDDFAIGDVEASSGGRKGAVNIHYGRPSLSSSPDLTLRGQTSASSFGFAVNAAGDVNKDGISDLVVGDPIYSVPPPPNGRAYVFLGSAPWTDAAQISPSDGNGVAWVDYDKDGYLDVYISRFTAGSTKQLWRNNGAGGFTNVTAAPMNDMGAGRGLAWGDYDNDGDQDLYICNSGSSNKLFRNDGAGTFADVTTTPVIGGNANRGAAWGDYDRDGDLDLYIVSESNVLARNDGATFAALNVAPLNNGGASGRAAAWGDIDGDGDLDLYLVNQSTPNKLLRNDGSGVFSNITDANPAAAVNGIGKGAAFGDYDNDLDLDLYVVNEASPNVLLRNDTGTFVAAMGSGVAPLLLSGPANTAVWGDYDLDGDIDLYLTEQSGPSKLFRNEVPGQFVEAMAAPVASGYGAAWGDYDQDGDLDLLTSHLSAPVQIVRNESSNGRKWLRVNLVGTLSNRSGVGARVRVVTGSASQIREVSGGDGFFSQNSITAEFGLGTSAAVDTVEVRWPSGIVQVLTGVTTNQLLTVTESQFTNIVSSAFSIVATGRGVAWGDYDSDGDQDVFVASASGCQLIRNDGGTAFVDVTPAIMSSIGGAGVAWGDYDNDGSIDLFVATDTQDHLYRNLGGGSFSDVTAGDLLLTGAGRGVGWADYDRDGDLDLFVANSSANNRLFRNDGSSVFVNVANPVLADGTSSHSGVAWADYDKDGDPDLYLANTGSPSRLFRNDGGNFVVASAGQITQTATGGAWGDFDGDGDLDLFSTMGSGNGLSRNEGGTTFVNVATPLLQQVGQGSRGPAWGDVDNDGDLDLMVTGNAAKLFRNDGGTFVDATHGSLGTGGTSQGAAWADIDNDGNLDLYMGLSNPDTLHHNTNAGKNRWLEVELMATNSNRSAIGASVRIRTGSKTQMRQVEGGGGHQSQNALIVHFGLGNAATVDTVEIKWPTGAGTTQVLKNVVTNQRLIVTEPAAGPDIVSIDKTAAPSTGACVLVLSGLRLDVAGTSVSLTGPSSILGTITAASGTGLTASFNVDSAPVGSYDVSVINSLGSDALSNALILHSSGVLMTRSTQSTATDADPAIPHTAGPMDTLIFVSNRGGTSELYLKNPFAPDTAPLTALTSLGSVANPSFSPNGRKVVFENAGSLYILDLQTLGAPTLLTTGLEPEWSPLGDLIIYRKAVGAGHAIFSIHPDGTGTLQLTTPNGVTIDTCPVWSPDGQRIAFLRDESGIGLVPLLYVIPAFGGNGTLMSQLVGIREMSWSPEGRWIAASSNLGAGNFFMYLVNTNGQGFIQISPDATEHANPCWNADGTQLAFTATYSGNQDVYVVSDIAALADQDADLAPDPLDACVATAPPLGQIDRNFNGCGDPGSSFRFPRFWNADQLPISYQTTGLGDPRITDGSEFGSLTDAMNAWVGVPGSGLSGGDDGTRSGPRDVVAADGKNSISFGDEDGFIAGTLALTLSTVAEADTVINGRWYRPGEIVDADILFNANDFHFSTATTIPTSDSYNLRAVATHEFGHFFGLSHSVIVGATMYAVVPRNTSAWSLERDDMSLLRRGYAADTTRSVDGRVLRSDGATPVVGAVVMAVASSAPLDTLQMTVTGVDGTYRFYDLDRSFRIYVTPLDGGDGVNQLTASYINNDLVALAETDFQPEFWDGGAETNHDGGSGVITPRPGPLVAGANIVLDVDVTPPEVASTYPEEGNTVSVTTALIVRFNEAIDFSSVSGTDISLRNVTLDTGVGGVAAGLDDNTVIAFTPSAPLAYATNYRLTVKADIKDPAGNTLADSTVVNFQTEAQPPVSLTSISPATAAPGCAIVLYGEGFDPDPEDNTIQFAGASVHPTAATLDRLYAIVPPGALTGSVTVTVSANTSNGLAFSVLAPRPPPTANLVGQKAFGPAGPRKMDIAPDGSYIYVATTSGVTAVPTVPSNLSGSVVQYNIPGGCLNVAVMPGGNHLLALRPTAPELQILDVSVPGAISLAKEVSLGATPLDLAVVPGGGQVVISFANKLALVATPGMVSAPEFGQIIREWTYDAGPFLGPVSLSRDGSRIFAAAGNNRFAVFNADIGGGAIGSLRSGSPRETVAIPDGGSALGVDLSGTILEFDNEGVVRTVLAGGGGYIGVAVSPEGDFGYAADFILNQVDVLDLSVATTARIASFDTGIDPIDLVVAPDGSIIYVLTEGSGQLEAYDTIEGPYVAGFSPASGGPETLITLFGANFNPVPANNFVSMGAVVLTPISVNAAGTNMVVKQTALVSEGHLAVTTGGKTSNIVEYKVVNETDPGNFALTPNFDATVAAAQTVARAPDGTFLIVRGSDGTLSLLGESPMGLKYHRLLGSLSPASSGLVGPGPLVITPDGTTLFAGNRSASRVLAYSLDRDASAPITYLGVVQSASSPAILDPAAMAITPDGTRIYVASPADHRIVEFSASTRAVSASISGPFTAPTSIAMHPSGKKAYVLLQDGALGVRVGVFSVNPDSAGYRTRTGTVSLTGSPNSMHRILASPSGDRVYALIGSGSTYFLKNIDTNSALEIGSLEVGSGAGVPVVELNQSGTLAFVADPVATTLRVIDLDTFTFTTDLLSNAGFGSAQDLDVSRDDARLYVASGGVLLQADLTATGSLIFISGRDQVGVENQALTFPITVRGPVGSEGTAVTFQSLGGGTFGDGDAFGYAALDATNTARTQFNPGAGMGTRTVQAKLSGVTIQTTVTVVGDTALVPVNVVITSPPAAATVGVLTSVAASFSKGVNPATVSSTSFPVKQSGAAVEGTYHFADHERRITFVPRTPLAFSTTYTVDLTSALEDYNGNPLDNPTSFTFQTESAPTSVSLSALSPNAGVVGTPLVISGDGFEASTSANTVLFGTTAAVVERADPKALVTHVPDGAETGNITVTARSQTSNGLTFEVIVPAPEPVLDPSGDVEVPTSGNQVVVTPDEVRAYMTSPEGNTVVPILIETLVSEDPIAVGIYPVGIALSPDGRRAFVTNYYSNDVYVVDTEAGSPTFHEIKGTIDLSNHPIAAAVNPNGRELYIATAGASGEVNIYEADTENDVYSAKKSIETGSSNQTVTVTTDGGQLVIGTSFGIVLVDIEGDDYGAKKSIETGSSSQSVTVTPDGGFVLVLTATGTLLLIDIHPDLTEAEIEDAKKSIETGSTSQAVTVSPDGGEVYVSTADGRILVFTLTLVGSGETALAERSNAGLSLVPADTLTVGENLAGLSFVNRDKLIVVDAGASTVRLLGGGDQWISCDGATTNYAGTLFQADTKDTLTVALATGAIQIRNTLSWTPTGGTNLDLALYQRTGVSPVTGKLIKRVTGAALPETLLVQGLAPGTYFYEITRASAAGTQIDWSLEAVTCTSSVIGAPEPAPPVAYRLLQSFPNPFRAGGAPARIRFALPDPGNVRLQLFDVRGALVRSLVHEWMDKGEHEASWDGRTDQGANAAAGVYFYRLEVEQRFVSTRRMLLLR